MKIEEIVKRTVLEMLAVGREPKSFYKATCERLYAYPTLMVNIERLRLDAEDLRREGITSKSKDITSWGGSGVRLTPEERQAAKIIHVERRLASDEAEVAAIDECLERLEDDERFFVQRVFFSGQTAEQMDMPLSSFQRRRGRLVQKISVMLYGADALK